jgi:hypothetical protein
MTSRVDRQLEKEKTYRCPCCSCKSLYGRGQDEICPVCFWHDDGQDDPEADEVWGGPNYDLSLSRALENFEAIGACCERVKPHVRAALQEEL